MSHKATDVVEDVEFMLMMGEHPARICQRVNRKPGSVANLLKRHGRTDLVSPFVAEDAWARDKYKKKEAVAA